MALTAEQKEVARAAGLVGDVDNIDPTTAGALATLAPAVKAMITNYAPDAPAAVRKAACVRLLGWMWDADPADPKATGRGLYKSGAASMLTPWRSITFVEVAEAEAAE